MSSQTGNKKFSKRQKAFFRFQKKYTKLQFKRRKGPFYSYIQAKKNRHYPFLKGKSLEETAQNTVRYVINCLKGRAYHPDLNALFSARNFYKYTTKTLNELEDSLQDAWWIEEDDIRQEIMIYIWKYKLNSGGDLTFYLLRAMRDYIINKAHFFTYGPFMKYQKDSFAYYNKINREERWSTEYNYSSIVLDESKLKGLVLPAYEQYISYLYYTLGLSREEACDRLLIQARQINRLQLKMLKEMENFYGKIKDAK